MGVQHNLNENQVIFMDVRDYPKFMSVQGYLWVSRIIPKFMGVQKYLHQNLWVSRNTPIPNLWVSGIGR